MMLDLYGPSINAFIGKLEDRFTTSFPDAGQLERALLERAAREALETLLTCDCPYHDVHHTMLVTDAGLSILSGRQLVRGDVQASEWLHAVIAMLYHDIGYVRGLLRGDREGSYVADEIGNRAIPVPGATDAFLTPFHVTRSCLYVQDRFGPEQLLDTNLLASHIEMTRFPVPADSYYQGTDSLSAMVRAADLIGQMGDPQYLRKLSRLYAEFVETGEAERQGYTNAGDLRASFPEFFQDAVYPHITDALRYLSKTRDGQQWSANLFAHVHAEQESEGLAGPERAPLRRMSSDNDAGATTPSIPAEERIKKPAAVTSINGPRSALENPRQQQHDD
ncbi:MAG: metal-dependent phosphohydrolase [Pseudomonadota bacterium]